MKKLVLSLMSVAMLFLFTGCIQNLKENVLILENNSAAQIRFEFRGEAYTLEPASTDPKTGTKVVPSMTIKDIKQDKYSYNIVAFADPTKFDAIEFGEGNTGDLDYTSNGWKIRMNFFSTTETTIDEKTKLPVVKIVVIGTSTGGWNE